MDTNGEFGMICDDYWNIAAGNVVCRILGYGSAISAPTQAFFGAGDGSIILDNVQCDGGEKSLFGCKHDLQNDCVQSEAAGLVCSGTM